MSRHIIPAKEPEKYEVCVGYDRPLNVFFGTVHDRLAEDVEEDLVYWADSEPSVTALARRLAHWADLSADVQAQLTKDSIDEPAASQNSPLQNEIARLFHQTVIVNGVHYTMGDEQGKGMRGFGGANHVIKFLDTNEEVVSTNLWHQGIIPEYAKEQLPDNAIFVKKGGQAVSTVTGEIVG